ncbi:MAG: site-specific integrase [Acidobacteriota bacterium]|nr:site-specific integrase [Acidobacteriota bacterium]
MSVRKRGEHWFVDISEKGRHRVQRLLKGARTKAQALKAEAKIRTQIFEKSYGLTETPECRFDKFVDSSFLPTKELKKSYASIDSICKALKGFFGKHFIAEIDTEMVERYRQVRVKEKTRLGRNRSPLRVNKEMQVLSSIFTLALEEKLIASRPRTTMFRVSGERVRYLTSDEEKRLFEHFDGCEWLRSIVLMALHTGMRRGEIFGLQWFDLNFDCGLIHVRNTKNGKDRLIPMNATVRAVPGDQPKTSSFVFPSPRTEERLVEIKYAFSHALKDAKIRDLRFHDLRHTAATRMGDAGADAFTLAAIFGWSDIRMAMRYTHAMEDAKRRAVEAIAQNFISRDHSVTNEKPTADQIAASG